MKMPIVGTLLILVAACGLVSCSKVRGFDEAKLKEVQSKHARPDWSAVHMQTALELAEAKDGSVDGCALCHAGEKNRGKPLNVTCGQSCHAADNVVDPAAQQKYQGTKVWPIQNECAQCHDTETAHRSEGFAHAPVAAGMCVMCHVASPEHLLSGDKNSVKTDRAGESCARCHEPTKTFGTLDGLHPALTFDGTCLNCHGPHGSKQKYFVKDKPEALCLSCHESHQGKSVHGAVKTDQSCLSCHVPHASQHRKLTNAPIESMCLSCHDKPIETESRTIPNIKEKVTAMPAVHAAKDMGDSCATCHVPHASEFDRLLNKNYLLASHGEYFNEGNGKPNTYALCFDCHDTAMVNEPAFEGTAFRNGSANLHWVHVRNATGSTGPKWGITCGMCHDPHGTSQDRLIRSAFGPYQSLLVFQLVGKIGGDCLESCHGPISYRREQVRELTRSDRVFFKR